MPSKKPKQTPEQKEQKRIEKERIKSEKAEKDRIEKMKAKVQKQAEKEKAEKEKKLQASGLSISDATKVRIGQLLTGMILKGHTGKKEMTEQFAKDYIEKEAKKFTHQKDASNYARKLRELTDRQLTNFLLTVKIISSDDYETNLYWIKSFFNSNNEPFGQDKYIREYKRRGEEYIKKMLHMYDGKHIIHRFISQKGFDFKKNLTDEFIKYALTDLVNSRGLANHENIDENNEVMKHFVKEWIQDLEPLEEAIKREQELFDPDLFEAIKKDTKLRETGRTDKYDIHVQDAIYKPLREYRRNAIHSVKQIVDMDLFNRIRI